MRLVHRHGVGRDQRIELRERVGDLPAVEGDTDDAFVVVDADDTSKVAVEDLRRSRHRPDRAAVCYLMIGRKLTADLALSLEVSVPIVKDYPVYDFKTEVRLNMTF